jgi:RNA polymerase sigma factor (sigma-70 family)
MDELLRHGAWLNLLARHVGGDDGEDALQDVWANAPERPSGIDSPRRWLARVLVNRIKSRARSDRRRRRRELASAAWTREPATPEEAAARAELHRLLATAVTELAEPYRHVVYLRYFEHREPSEIARLLGTPAGTIRWRLKQALSQLRARLDQHREGKSERWTALLGPAFGEHRPGRWSWTRALVATASLSAVVVAGAGTAWLSSSNDSGVRSSVSSGDSGAPRPAATAFGLPPAPALTTSVDGGNQQEVSCAATEALRSDLASLKRQSDPWRHPRELFAEGRPNAALEARARPLFARLLQGADEACRHSVSCRGAVCEVTLLIPDGLQRLACQPGSLIEPLRDHLSSGISSGGGASRPTFDPLEGKAYTRTLLWRRFHREDGLPVPLDQRPPFRELRWDFTTRRPRRPPALPEPCVPRWTRLAAELDHLEDWITQVLPDQVFASSAPDEPLTRRVKDWAASTLGPRAAPLPFDITCHGRACAVVSSTGMEDAGWYRALRDEARAVGRLVESIRQPDGVRARYLVVTHTGAGERSSPWGALVAFADSFDWRAGVTSCEARFGDRGILRVMLQVPDNTGESSPASRISVHVGGPLASTALGRCVAQLFAEASAAFSVPARRAGAVFAHDFTFPFDPSSFAAKITRHSASASRRGTRL